MVVSQLFGEFGEGSRLMTPTTVVRGKGREARRPGYLLSRHQDQEERSAYVGRLLHYQAHRQRVHARPCHWRVYSRRADQGRQRDRAAKDGLAPTTRGPTFTTNAGPLASNS